MKNLHYKLETATLLMLLAFILHPSPLLLADPPTTTQTPVTATTGTAAYALLSATAGSVTGPINGGQLQSQSVSPGSLTNTLGSSGTIAIGNGAISFLAEGLVGSFTPPSNLAVTSGTYPSLVSGSAAVSGSSQLANYATAAGSGTATALSAGLQASGSNTEYVMIGGNDATAMRGDIGHPYATGTAAYAAAHPYDCIYFGPTASGTYFSALNITGTTPVWVRGSGKPDYAGVYPNIQLQGGTVFHGYMGINPPDGSTISGVRCTDFGVDNGLVLSGTYPGSWSDCFNTNGTLGGGTLNYPDSVIHCTLSHIAVLGCGEPAVNIQHAFSLQCMVDSVLSDLDARYCFHGVVIKSRRMNISQINTFECYADGLLFKRGGSTTETATSGFLYAQDCVASDIVITGTGDVGSGLDFQEDPYDASAPPVHNISVSNVRCYNVGVGVEPVIYGTSSPMAGIEISNYGCESTGTVATFALNPVYNNTPALSPQIHFTNCNAINAKWVVNGSGFTFTNCRVDASPIGWELNPSLGYSDFIGCSANNCNAVTQFDGINTVYLFKHGAILITGTYGSLDLNNSVYAESLPYLLKESFSSSAVTATSLTDLWQYPGGPGNSGGGIGGEYLPGILDAQMVRTTTRGHYSVNATGTNTITFAAWWDGSDVNSSNDITVTLPNGSSGNFELVREFGGGASAGNTYEHVNSWLVIGGSTTQLASAQKYMFFPSFGSNHIVSEAAAWSGTGNSITTDKAFLEVPEDPWRGY